MFSVVVLNDRWLYECSPHKHNWGLNPQHKYWNPRHQTSKYHNTRYCTCIRNQTGPGRFQDWTERSAGDAGETATCVRRAANIAACWHAKRGRKREWGTRGVGSAENCALLERIDSDAWHFSGNGKRSKGNNLEDAEREICEVEPQHWEFWKQLLKFEIVYLYTWNFFIA